MSTEVKRLTREELYAVVWDEPMTKVSARFNLSDVGLKKICCKNCIPVPGRGYWRRVQTGRRVIQTPLPPMDHAPMIEIAVRPRRRRKALWSRPKRKRAPRIGSWSRRDSRGLMP